jgi:hypothetical protein
LDQNIACEPLAGILQQLAKKRRKFGMIPDKHQLFLFDDGFFCSTHNDGNLV